MALDNAVDPEIEEQLEKCRWAVYHAQHRYGLLIGTYRRVNLLQGHFPGKQVYNSTAVQPFFDSFDMLVIDLCSAAKAWLDEKGGLFKLLSEKPEVLRRRSEDDFGGGDKGRTIAKGVNAVIAEIFPDGDPGNEAVKDWGRRFDAATKRVRDDRNKVRAHRYEQVRVTAPLSTYAAPLEEYEKHVTYFTEHVYQASMAIKAISFDRNEAADLADLIFHGSIDGAVWAYRLVSRATSKEPPPRYEDLRDSALGLLERDPGLYDRAFDGTVEDS
jgi:hypothetical protein